MKHPKPIDFDRNLAYSKGIQRPEVIRPSETSGRISGKPQRRAPIVLRTILFWITAVLGFMLLSPVAYMVRSRRQRVHKIQKIWSWLVVWVSGVKVEIEGLEYIQPYGSYMIMANHQSYFDVFVLLNLPLFIHWMAKEELFKIPFFGMMLRALGGISIDREKRGKGYSSIRQAARTIQNGKTVLVFPEGTRSTSGELLPFTEGGFFLAILSRAVVLPIVIRGSYKIMPKGSFRVSSGAVRVAVKPPIETRGFSLNERDNLQEMVRDVFLEALQDPRSSGG